MKNHLIIKGVGWSQSAGTNWCYRYYDVTIITNDLSLLPLQGIYEDTFGSCTNYLSSLREIENLDIITDDNLSETRQGRRAMKMRIVATDFKTLEAALKASA